MLEDRRRAHLGVASKAKSQRHPSESGRSDFDQQHCHFLVVNCSPHSAHWLPRFANNTFSVAFHLLSSI